jgi:CHAD domain-containing protein
MEAVRSNIKKALIGLNVYKNHTYKLKVDNETDWILYKQFHQLSKQAKSTRMYAVELFRTPYGENMIAFIEGLKADKEY